MGAFQFSTFGKPNASIGLSTKMRLRVLSSGTQRRLINNSNSALVLQAPVAINIASVHALALDALYLESSTFPKCDPPLAYKHPGGRLCAW